MGADLVAVIDGYRKGHTWPEPVRKPFADPGHTQETLIARLARVRVATGEIEALVEALQPWADEWDIGSMKVSEFLRDLKALFSNTSGAELAGMSTNQLLDPDAIERNLRLAVEWLVLRDHAAGRLVEKPADGGEG